SVSLYCVCYMPHLRAFPTRRSSDLASPRTIRSCSSGVWSVTCCTGPMPLAGSAFSATAEDSSSPAEVADCDPGRSGLQPENTRAITKTSTLALIMIVPDEIADLFIVVDVFSGTKLLPERRLIYD